MRNKGEVNSYGRSRPVFRVCKLERVDRYLHRVHKFSQVSEPDISTRGINAAHTKSITSKLPKSKVSEAMKASSACPLDIPIMNSSRGAS